jgi:putative Holliday junction resolvase
MARAEENPRAFSCEFPRFRCVAICVWRARPGRTNQRYNMNVTEVPLLPIEQTPLRILALDYGRSRIGIALADSVVGLAQPLCTLERVNRNEDMRRLRELAREHHVRQIVVGLPLRLDGSRGEMADEAEGFAQRVRKQVGVPVELVDERLTSWEAERLLEETAGRVMKHPVGHHKKSKVGEGRMSVDAVAAAVILKDYLELRQTRETEPTDAAS